MVCDLRLGGTLSGSGLTGGMSVHNSRISVADWSGIHGSPGYNTRLVRVAGRAGGYPVGDGMPFERSINLDLLVTRWAATGPGSLTEATSGAQVEANTDTLLGVLADPDGFYIEEDLDDGSSRFTHGRAVTVVTVRQREWRRVNVPVVCEWPYWSAGGSQSTDTLTGSDTLTVGGNVDVYNPVLEFSGDGTLTHTALGWTITVTGSVSAVTVDLGARTVVQAGVNADSLMSHNTAYWGRFVPGVNAVTCSGALSVAVTWRDQWS